MKCPPFKALRCHKHICIVLVFALFFSGCSSVANHLDIDEFYITTLQAKMQNSELSSEQIVQYYLLEIEALNPQLNAVIEINPDAISIAQKLDEERANGNVRSQLHGIPVLLKDNIDTADKMLTTAGSLALVDAPIPNIDAFLVKKLREAGAVILGKANLSEWANFRSSNSSSGWSSRGGQTRNPYIVDRTPCGSSSGSAVAVAANLTVLAVGTETDGSIVCPSSNNGIVGIKPTIGMVSRSGVIPISHSQDTAGPMARNVRDAALLLQAMIGEDKADATTISRKENLDVTANLDANFLNGKRIGIVTSYAGQNHLVDTLIEENIALMKQAGAEIVEVEIPTLRQIGAAEIEVLLYEFKHDLNHYLSNRGGSIDSLTTLIQFNRQHAQSIMPYFAQELFERAEEKVSLNDEVYKKALADSKRLSREEGIDKVMDEFELDALIAPTNGPGWKIDLMNGDSPSGYVSSSTIAAVAGYPSVTVPAGFIKEWPIGISFFGRAFSEPTLIGMAYAFEQISQARKPPKFLSSYETKSQ